jgi:hypothetical protein
MTAVMAPSLGTKPAWNGKFSGLSRWGHTAKRIPFLAALFVCRLMPIACPAFEASAGAGQSHFKTERVGSRDSCCSKRLS